MKDAKMNDDRPFILDEGYLALADTGFQDAMRAFWHETWARYPRMVSAITVTPDRPYIPVLPLEVKGYVAIAIYTHDLGGGNLRIGSMYMLKATNQGGETVLRELLDKIQTEHPEHRVMDTLVEEIRPDLMRKALGLEPLADE